MKEYRDDGGPAFPVTRTVDNNPPTLLGGPALPGDIPSRTTFVLTGMSLRDYFAIHAPEPTIDDVKFEMRADAERNPHGDSHKPPRRTMSRIVADLRYAFADAMLAGRKT